MVWFAFKNRPVVEKGAGVSVITGLDLSDDELKKLATELKKRCGCGGSVKDGNIEIQGEKRDLLKTTFRTKRV